MSKPAASATPAAATNTPAAAAASSSSSNGSTGADRTNSTGSAAVLSVATIVDPALQSTVRRWLLFDAPRSYKCYPVHVLCGYLGLTVPRSTINLMLGGSSGGIGPSAGAGAIPAPVITTTLNPLHPTSVAAAANASAAAAAASAAAAAAASAAANNPSQAQHNANNGVGSPQLPVPIVNPNFLPAPQPSFVIPPPPFAAPMYPAPQPNEKPATPGSIGSVSTITRSHQYLQSFGGGPPPTHVERTIQIAEASGVQTIKRIHEVPTLMVGYNPPALATPNTAGGGGTAPTPTPTGPLTLLHGCNGVLRYIATAANWYPAPPPSFVATIPIALQQLPPVSRPTQLALADVQTFGVPAVTVTPASTSTSTPSAAAAAPAAGAATTPPTSGSTTPKMGSGMFAPLAGSGGASAKATADAAAGAAGAASASSASANTVIRSMSDATACCAAVSIACVEERLTLIDALCSSLHTVVGYRVIRHQPWSNAVLTHHFNALSRSLSQMNAQLLYTPWCCGAVPTIADFSLIRIIESTLLKEIDIASYTGIVAWMDRFCAVFSPYTIAHAVTQGFVSRSPCAVAVSNERHSLLWHRHGMLQVYNGDALSHPKCKRAGSVSSAPDGAKSGNAPLVKADSAANLNRNAFTSTANPALAKRLTVADVAAAAAAKQAHAAAYANPPSAASAFTSTATDVKSPTAVSRAAAAVPTLTPGSSLAGSADDFHALCVRVGVDADFDDTTLATRASSTSSANAKLAKQLALSSASSHGSVFGHSGGAGDSASCYQESIQTAQLLLELTDSGRRDEYNPSCGRREQNGLVTYHVKPADGTVTESKTAPSTSGSAPQNQQPPSSAAPTTPNAAAAAAAAGDRASASQSDVSIAYGVVDGTVEDLAEYVSSFDVMTALDASFGESAVIEEISSRSLLFRTSVELKRVSAGVTRQARFDFCVLSRRFELPDSTIVVAYTSVHDKRCPAPARFIRARIQHSGWVLRPVPGQLRKTLVHAVFHVKWNGAKVSDWIIDGIQLKPLTFLSALRREQQLNSTTAMNVPAERLYTSEF